MSHQANEGWFPVCLVCGCGNLAAIVCLDPTAHQDHEGERIDYSTEVLIERDRHWWKLCHWCQAAVRADPCAWGTYALCIECWNRFAAEKVLPPTSPRGAHGS